MNEEDDWSLKGRGNKTWQTDNPTIEWLTYKDSDIETLRKKLLEDISKLAGKYGIECNSDVIFNIINKRFGEFYE